LPSLLLLISLLFHLCGGLCASLEQVDHNCLTLHNDSGIPISIYPSMICLELDRITERMSSKSLKNLDQNSFLTAIPNDNFQKKCERCK
jgi:hypothetical protein